MDPAARLLARLDAVMDRLDALQRCLDQPTDGGRTGAPPPRVDASGNREEEDEDDEEDASSDGDQNEHDDSDTDSDNPALRADTCGSCARVATRLV